jgi:hypothetical protein
MAGWPSLTAVLLHPTLGSVAFHSAPTLPGFQHSQLNSVARFQSGWCSSCPGPLLATFRYRRGSQLRNYPVNRYGAQNELSSP